MGILSSIWAILIFAVFFRDVTWLKTRPALREYVFILVLVMWLLFVYIIS
jgi:hypothetical protein